ncbi:uncharacterized protein LOC131438391 [Malaya genurostris]|uniref:uncharacterized protein LOC131438391 n=1 Tax=Malaya genurostris TaxID=325434 RepID=UPI0026F3A5ED|nr:uncharacterized protein LOC131438391 [Malaya genurostris]XP_058464388.1 uncharacterized protein LOC131438391 [Malaya genurostris]
MTIVKTQIVSFVLLFLFALTCVSGADLQVTNATKIDDGTPESPYETQTAQCTITSGEVEASAQATISKTLVGVCGTDEMLTAFRTLEAKLLLELSNLRVMIRDPNFNPPPLQASEYKSIKRVNNQLGTSTGTKLSSHEAPRLSTTSSTTPKSAGGDVYFPDEDHDDSGQKFNRDMVKEMPQSNRKPVSPLVRVGNDQEDVSIKQSSANSHVLDFKPIDKPIQTRFLTGGLRDYEVYRFNNTVVSSGDAKVYKYFWKIEHFTERLQSNVSTLSSPVFVISGLNLRLKATLNHEGKDNVYMQLEQLSAMDDELRKKPNVILQEGSLYGGVETKKFLRHKIVLLNQGVPFSDLNSRDFWNTNTGFTIPYRALLTNSYLKQDKILVEVVIYL